MAEKAKKMSQAFDAATGTLTFSFPGLEPLAYRLSDFPENVVQFWTGFGMKTTGRNASIGSDEDGSVGTPETMRQRVAAKFEQWRQGILRMAASGEERASAPTLLIEAYGIAKRMQAAIEAGDDADNWAAYPAIDPAELRAKLDEMAATVTNPGEVAAARAKAEAAGEDGDDAAAKAEITQLDIAKAKNLFKLALNEAKAQRAAARKAELKAKLAAEVAAG